MTLTPAPLSGRCELCERPADALTATVFGAACTACSADLYENLADDVCPACDGTGGIDVPTVDGPDQRGCPVCRPWHGRFPGVAAFGRWVISPAAPGEAAVWHGWDDGPAVDLADRSS